jgi:hypothetical protein
MVLLRNLLSPPRPPQPTSRSSRELVRVHALDSEHRGWHVTVARDGADRLRRMGRDHRLGRGARVEPTGSRVACGWIVRTDPRPITVRTRARLQLGLLLLNALSQALVLNHELLCRFLSRRATAALIFQRLLQSRSLVCRPQICKSRSLFLLFHYLQECARAFVERS